MKPLSIRQQILLIALLPCIGISSLVGLYIFYNYTVELDSHLHNHAAATSRLLAMYASQDIVERPEQLQNLANAALEEPGMRGVRLLDASGQVLSEAGPQISTFNEGLSATITQQSTPRSVLIRRPIFAVDSSAQQQAAQSRTPLGWVELEYNRHRMSIAKYQTFLGSSLAIISVILIAGLLAAHVIRRISQNIGELRQGIQAMSQGFYDTHFYLPGQDEIHQLAEDLNVLKASINSTFHNLKANLENSNTDLRETLDTLEIQHIELDMARREALEASRMKSEFLANTSHEIRTPLNSIIGFTNILLKYEHDAQRKNYLETIRLSADNLLSIINDVLDFSKIDAGKLVLDSMPINIRELAEDALCALAPQANDKQLELAVISDPALPAGLLSDPLRLRQIFTNLFSNAIKFTPAGHVCCDIKLNSLEASRANITVEITDTGIGIPAGQQQDVFSAFTQADSSTSREFGGTGLGLVIVKRLVEQMGGEVGVRSVEGEGSTFWFTLSLPVEDIAEPARAFHQFHGRRIAIIEPESLSRNSLIQLLSTWELDVHAFDNWKSLQQQNRDWDCVIYGLRPGKAQPSAAPAPKTPILFLSATPECVSVPAPHQCLAKPCPHLRLFDALTEILRNPARPDDLPIADTVDKVDGEPSVLIVDDNPANLQMLSLMLKEVGIHAQTADSGMMALSLCQQQPFDLVFLDLQMPQMDGIETARRIRSDSLCKDSELIALSAYLSPEDPSRLRQAGIDLYFSKPMTDAKLESILRRLNKTPAPAQPVDLQRCLMLARDKPALAQQMLSMLINSLEDSCTQLQSALDSKDVNQLRDCSHQLSGACAYVGVPRLQHRARALFDLSSQKTDWPKVAEAAQALIVTARELQHWQREHDMESLFSPES